MSDRVSVLANQWMMSDFLSRSHDEVVGLHYQFYKSSLTGTTSSSSSASASAALMPPPSAPPPVALVQQTPTTASNLLLASSSSSSSGQGSSGEASSSLHQQIPPPPVTPVHKNSRDAGDATSSTIATPAPSTFKSASQDGLITIYIANPNSQVQSFRNTSSPSSSTDSAGMKHSKVYATQTEMLQDLITQYTVPEVHIFPLFHRLRIALILNQENKRLKDQLFLIRILSIAVWGNAVAFVRWARRNRFFFINIICLLFSPFKLIPLVKMSRRQSSFFMSLTLLQK